MAKRFECASRLNTGLAFNHDSGDGTPRRKKCSYCGGRFVTFEGEYGTFEWTGSNRYPAEAAVATFPTYAKAEASLSPRSALVIRWISADTKVGTLD